MLQAAKGAGVDAPQGHGIFGPGADVRCCQKGELLLSEHAWGSQCESWGGEAPRLGINGGRMHARLHARHQAIPRAARLAAHIWVGTAPPSICKAHKMPPTPRPHEFPWVERNPCIKPLFLRGVSDRFQTVVPVPTLGLPCGRVDFCAVLCPFSLRNGDFGDLFDIP